MAVSSYNQSIKVNREDSFNNGGSFFVPVICAEPVNPWQLHWRGTPNLWQIYEATLSILLAEYCNVTTARFSINLERSFPNKKVWAFTISLPARGSLLIRRLLFDACTNIPRHWILAEETYGVPRLVELWTIQRCNHDNQAPGQLKRQTAHTSHKFGPVAQIFVPQGSCPQWSQ